MFCEGSTAVLCMWLGLGLASRWRSFCRTNVCLGRSCASAEPAHPTPPHPAPREAAQGHGVWQLKARGEHLLLTTSHGPCCPGYDVWLMNTRGNTFSRAHDLFPVGDSRFWRFSMDHMALSDLPATMNYIKKVTGAPKVSAGGPTPPHLSIIQSLRQ